LAEIAKGQKSLLEVMSLEVTVEGIRTGTGMDCLRKRIPYFGEATMKLWMQM